MVFSYPSTISDKNDFLKNFVNHEFLSLLGVMTTINLGSVANLQFSLNKLQSYFGKDFPNTRKTLKRSAYSLLFIMLISFLVVIIKPNFLKYEYAQAIFNSLAIMFFLCSLSVTFDITKASLMIPPIPTEKSDDDGNS